MLLLESMLMLGTGCIAGAGVGVAGQFVIDQYLQLVTGFPVARIASAARPLETLVLVVGLVLLLIAVPAWAAAGVAPAEALAE
jgi:ABC-type antimicrobial peptide transport system permease subunit